MEFIVIIILLFICIGLIISLKNTNKKKQNINNEYERLKTEKIEDFNEETTKKCQSHIKEEEQKFLNFQKSIDEKIEIINKLVSEKEARYEEVNQDLTIYRKNRLNDIDKEVSAKKETNLKLLEIEIDKTKEEYTQKMNKIFEEKEGELNFKKEEISKIQLELDDLRSRRAAVNKEILRQKKIQEQEEFFKIQLPEEDKPDIEILRATAPRLRHPEAINKIIWSNYYQKPLAELRKRLLPDGDYSGVYKITRIKTGEVYIGQTTSIDKRFQDHVKSALGVGTLTSSQLHRVIALDGPENFTFEILERVTKDKLKEKESYYIDFYDSKNYGLNSIKGQKNG